MAACRLLVPFLFALAVHAQHAAAPPPELAKLDRLVGSWTWEGQVWFSPDAEPGSWTSTSTSKKVLGGHAIVDRVRIEAAGPMPFKLGFVTFFGYDRGAKKYWARGYGNMGKIESTEIEWLDGDTMLQVSRTVENGQPVIERWVTKLFADRQEMVGERAVGSGPFTVHVKGTGKRAEAAKDVDVDDLPAAFGATASEEMKRLSRLAGRYQIKGTFAMAPDQPPVAFSGTEEIRPLFDGTVLSFHAKGDDGNYEAFGAMAYDPIAARYRIIEIDSMGENRASEAWYASDTEMLAICQGFHADKPLVARTVLVLDAQGRPSKGHAHSLHGTAAPFKSFESTYTPVPAGNTSR